MAALVDWQQSYGDSALPLWQEAEQIHDGGKAWREVAEILNGRYGLELAGATCSSQVKYYRTKAGDDDGHGGGGRGAKVTAEGNGDEGDESFGGRGGDRLRSHSPAAVEDEGQTAAPGDRDAVSKRRPPDDHDDDHGDDHDDSTGGNGVPGTAERSLGEFAGANVPPLQDDGNGDGNGGEGGSNGEGVWRVTIEAPGFSMRAEGASREELCARLQLVDGVLA